MEKLRALIREIHRRSLWQVLAIYVVASWAAFDAAQTLTEGLGLPEWLPAVAFVLLVVGLPVVLATAFIQEGISTPSAPDLELAPSAGSSAATSDDGDRAKRLFTWRNAIIGGLAAGTLWGVLATGWILFGFRGATEPSSPRESGLVESQAAPGIAVMPFRVVGDTRELWREGMVDLLSIKFDEVPGLRAIDSRTVLARWDEVVLEEEFPDLQAALKVGQRTGARYLLLGNVVTTATEIHLSTQVYDILEANKVGQGEVVGSPDSIFPLVDRLVIQTLRGVQKGHTDQFLGVDLSGVTTDSLSALVAFLEGERLYREADSERAIAAYERAVEIDSTFALANLRLSMSDGWVEAFETALGRQGKERAARYADRLPTREAIKLRAALALEAGVVDGIEHLKEAVRRYPDDPEIWYLLGESYWHLGDRVLAPLDDGEHALDQAVSLDPTFAVPYLHRIDYAFLRADSARSASLIDTLALFAPRTELLRVYQLTLSVAFGDDSTRTEAFRQLDSIGLPPALQWNHPRFERQADRIWETGWQQGHMVARIVFPIHKIAQGQVTGALALMDDPAFPVGSGPFVLYYAHMQGLPLPPERLDAVLSLSAVNANLDADPTGSLFSTANIFFAGAYAAEQGHGDEFHRAVRQLREAAGRFAAVRDSASTRMAHAAVLALEGLAAWNGGQHAEARTLLDTARVRAATYFNGNPVNGAIRWWLGELLLEMDEPREAIRYFASHTTPGDNFPVLHYADFRLGQIYEQLEEFEKAREAYRTFLSVWDDPDPDLHPLVEEARQALIRLRAFELE